MSDETTSTQATSTPNQNQPGQAPDSGPKPTLEEAFAGGGKSKLQKNLVRPKKLGLSSFNDGADDLSGVSKKAKKPLSKPKEEQVSFERPSQTEKEPEIRSQAALPSDKIENIDPSLDQSEIKPPEAPKKHKVKVNGEEFEVTEEELIRGYQLKNASYKAFQEADALRKSNEQLMMKMKNPETLLEVLQAFGYNPRQLAESYLGQELSFELMTPEQKEIHKLRAEKALRDREVQRQIQQQQQQAAQAQKSQMVDITQKSIIGALESSPDLPKDAETVRRIIGHMKTRIMAQQHLPPELQEDITPQSVLDDVRASIENDLRTKVSQMTPEQVAKFLGKEKLDEYRKWELSQIKNPIQKPQNPISPNQVQPTLPKRHFKTMEEFKENQRQNGVKVFGGRF